jgi:hypothetical protein
MNELVIDNDVSAEIRRYDVWHEGETCYLETDSRTWLKMNLYQISDVEEIVSQRSEHSAVTRSHLGYSVLNDPNLMSVDVDFNIRALPHQDFADDQFAPEIESVKERVQRSRTDRIGMFGSIRRRVVCDCS